MTPKGLQAKQIGPSRPYLLAEAPTFEFFPPAPTNPYIERAESLSEAKTYRWFARFSLVEYRVLGQEPGTLHLVEYRDLRFGLRTAFVFRVVLNAAGEVVGAGFVED